MSSDLPYFRCAHRLKALIGANAEQLEELKKLQVECELCNKMFRHQKVLNQHRRIVHEKRFPLHCKSCWAGFKTRTDLFRHRMSKCQNRANVLKTSVKGETGKCAHCGKEMDMELLDDDLSCYDCSENSKEDQKILFKCSECEDEFSSQEELMDHDCCSEDEDMYDTHIDGMFAFLTDFELRIFCR